MENLQQENQRLREALETIANPIAHFQKEADKEGHQLDGGGAVMLSNDVGWLQSVAKKALNQS